MITFDLIKEVYFLKNLPLQRVGEISTVCTTHKGEISEIEENHSENLLKFKLTLPVGTFPAFRSDLQKLLDN